MGMPDLKLVAGEAGFAIEGGPIELLVEVCSDRLMRLRIGGEASPSATYLTEEVPSGATDKIRQGTSRHDPRRGDLDATRAGAGPARILRQ